METTLSSLGSRGTPRRKVFGLALDAITASFTLRETRNQPFVAFVATDARVLSDRELKTFASILLERGCAYLCAWGPDCERIHDAMDRCIVGDDPPASYKGCVMTTWHSKNSLEEALWYFLFCVIPDEDYAPRGCPSAIAISIGSAEYENAIRQFVTSQT